MMALTSTRAGCAAATYTSCGTCRHVSPVPSHVPRLQGAALQSRHLYCTAATCHLYRFWHCSHA